jgi:fumarate reductase flavoprotein subunit
MSDTSTDIAIVGGGAAGLAAAIAAAEKGVGVAVFEKGATPGGAASMGMGPFAVESKLQRMKNIVLTREQAFKIFMDYTHWRVDAHLVSNYINKSADTIEWLESMGVVWGAVESYVRGSYPTHHQVAPPGGRPGTPMAASHMVKCMTDRAKQLGVTFNFRRPGKQLLKEGGVVNGVVVDGDPDEIEVRAKAVIIATGGFGSNREMIKKYTPYEHGKDLFSMRVPGMVGDGIRMAWEAGAGSEGLNMELTSVAGSDSRVLAGDMGDSSAMQATAFSPATPTFTQPNLVVNLLGERFMNEEEMGNTTFLGNAVARQKDRLGFVIYDADTARLYEAEGLDWPAAISGTTKVSDIDGEVRRAVAGGNPDLFVAETLDELAEKTGITAATLKATVAEYNHACDTGRDPVFHKRAVYLRPVRTPSFYAATIRPSGYGTLGGIKINHRTEVVTKDHGVIPGLYAAGTDACSIYADSYIFILPGNTMGFALNSGRMAGENSADYVASRSGS